MDKGTVTIDRGIMVPVILRKPLRRKSPQVVGVIKASLLTQRYEIPRRDTRRHTGYQREISVSRVNRLAEDLRKHRVDLPTAVLLNLREYKPDINLVLQDDKAFFIPDGLPLFVVDGQHRIEALTKLVSEEPAEWSDFEIAFSCMLGATEFDEMEEFYVVNSTAKSVRTDLALDLLKQRAERDPSVMDALIERSESWKVEAQALAEELSKTARWVGRIRFPGEPKATTTLGSSGMAGSFQDLLSNHFFSSIQRPQRIQILDSFWKGVALVLPEAFDNPTEFALQKSTGVQVMHRVLIPVLEYLRSKGKSVVEPESYAEVLREPLLKLQGDTTEGGVATGPDFWRAGQEGAAGGFSSNAGRRVLTARIKGALPPPEVV